MSKVTKVYHWANLVGIPGILLISLASGDESTVSLFVIWILISGLCNRVVRAGIVSVVATAAAIGWYTLGIGSVLLLVAAALIGFCIAPFYLWFSSLSALISNSGK